MVVQFFCVPGSVFVYFDKSTTKNLFALKVRKVRQVRSYLELRLKIKIFDFIIFYRDTEVCKILQLNYLKNCLNNFACCVFEPALGPALPNACQTQSRTPQNAKIPLKFQRNKLFVVHLFALGLVD